ncbi:MAG: hypothetical protein EZS28_039881, partial [Streblomastix strix]
MQICDSDSEASIITLSTIIIQTCRLCLYQIQRFGDEQDQIQLVNIRYGRVICIQFCTAGGVGEEKDKEIINGLNCIYFFLRDLHEGRNSYGQPSFQPLPLLV